MPADTGFILFLVEHGEQGVLSYISTIRREDVHRLIHEWLDHEDADHPATGWETAASLLVQISEAAGFDLRAGSTPAQLIAHLRRLRETAAS